VHVLVDEASMRVFLGLAPALARNGVWQSFHVMIWRDFRGAATDPRSEPSAVTVGNFDGVHRGHQHVLARTRELAAGLPVIAVTFVPHPLAVVLPEHAPPRLTTIERRVELLRAAGADEVRILNFTAEMASWSPQEFVDRVLVEQLSVDLVAVGDNFRFGFRASGDTAFLREAGERAGFAVDGLALDGGAVPWSGIVTKGDQRGRELGFPTANVPVDEGYAVPPDGVYAGWLVRADGERLPAAISVGTNPTFDGVERRVESYVLDRTDLDLYGEAIRVELVDRLRGMVTYEGIDPLIAQMHQDVENTRRILGN
jgi:riboflavin kinase/FMN adenylyltransferase